MGSHSVTCHPAEVTSPSLLQPNLVLDDLAIPDGCKAELTYRHCSKCAARAQSCIYRNTTVHGEILTWVLSPGSQTVVVVLPLALLPTHCRLIPLLLVILNWTELNWSELNWFYWAHLQPWGAELLNKLYNNTMILLFIHISVLYLTGLAKHVLLMSGILWHVLPAHSTRMCYCPLLLLLLI